MKKFRVILLTAVLAVAMMAGSLSVFAAAPAPAVKKTVEAAEGVKVPATTITFTATQAVAKDAANPDGTICPANVAIADTTVNVAATTSTGEAITPADATFNLAPFEAESVPAGEYIYEVKETAISGAGWTSDDTVYYMQVLKKADGTVRCGIVKKGEGDTIDIVKAKTAAADKEDSFKFTNKYEKKADLTVKKVVTNPEYINDDTFSFTITLAENGYAKVPADADIVVTSDATDTAEFTVSDGVITGELKNGETVTVKDLPAGLKYTVQENNPTDVNYTSTTATVNNEAVTVADGTGTKDVPQQIVSQDGNAVVVTNVYKPVTVTGVIMNILPFVMMIAIGGAAAALYVASRRRKMAR